MMEYTHRCRFTYSEEEGLFIHMEIDGKQIGWKVDNLIARDVILASIKSNPSVTQPESNGQNPKV